MIPLVSQFRSDPMHLLASIYPRGKYADLLLGVLSLLAMAAACKLASILWERYRSGKPFNNPRKLFADLCRAHHLDRHQKQLLLLLAQWHKLPQPAALFLRPELFEADKLGPQFSPQASQLRAMQQRLFKPAQSLANSSQPS